MKKKILFGLVFALIILSLLILPVFAAEDSPLRISEDYTTAEYNGAQYVRLDDVHVTLGNDYVNIYNTELTQTQENEILYMYAYDYGDFLSLDIEYQKGGYASYVYIRSNKIADYEAFLGGDVDQFVIDDYYLEINTTATEDQIKKNPVVVKGYEVSYYLYFVDVKHVTGSFEKAGGYILTDGTSYYYLDHYQFGPEQAIRFDAAEHETVTLYKITDRGLLSELKGNDDDRIDVSIDHDEAVITTVITGIILTLFLGLTPLAALILCLIFSGKARKPYRTLLRVIAILLAIELLAFSATAIWMIALL